MKTSYKIMLTAVMLIAALSLPLSAQNKAAEILNTARDKYVERMEGVSNYWVRTETMGQESTTYYTRTPGTEFPEFTQEREHAFGSTSSSGNKEFFRNLDDFARHASYDGTESVDGNNVHVISVTDFDELDFLPNMGDTQRNFEPKSLKLYLDANLYVPRKFVVEGETNAAGEGPQSLTITVLMSDYREKGGMLHPYLTEVNVKGLKNAMSGKDAAEMEQQLKMLEERMAQMPKDQQKMLAGQVQMLRNMVGGDGMTVTMKVTGMGVNEGKPQQ